MGFTLKKALSKDFLVIFLLENNKLGTCAKYLKTKLGTL